MTQVLATHLVDRRDCTPVAHGGDDPTTNGLNGPSPLSADRVVSDAVGGPEQQEPAVVTTTEAATDFLAQRRTAITGVSRTPSGHGAARVWMHRAAADGSVSAEAATAGRAGGMTVIEGGCPLMFDPTADLGHKLMKFVLSCTGSVPRHV